MNIGILTGGGDCPGLNAVIRSVVKRGLQLGHEFTGIREGWRGLVEARTMKLARESVSGLLPLGGTILGTSRTNPLKDPRDAEKLFRNLDELKIDALVCIGGDDTLSVASKLHEKGVKTVGVPKTIDNDLSGTDFTFGFDTAVSIVTWALDRLHSTTEAHQRVMVVEVMGRHAGWIAVYGGMAGGADVILIPEQPFDIDEVCGYVTKRREAGKYFSLIVAAEGAFPKGAGGMITKDKALDAFGHARLGGVGEFLANEIEKRLGVESRYVVLGHLQRGGTPTAYDRVLATRFGVKAIEMVHDGKYGRMVALQGNKVVDVSLKEATAELKTVDLEMLRTAQIFFG
ncbi:MAG: 6-phosphofructokinase [Thermodesulfobacteriota bacterium]|nr:MAG: 6-phosphofructokinase [Thermodesulfobacteriota bacterium]